MTDLLSHLEKQLAAQEVLLREREQDLQQLRRDLDRLAQLNRQRAELLTQLRAIDHEMGLVEQSMLGALRVADVPVAPRVAPVPPPSRATSGSRAVPVPAARVTSPPTPPSGDAQVTTLKDEIRKVLGGTSSPLGTAEIANRVKAGGYKTSTTNFAPIVKKHLTEMEDVMQVPGRGYRLRK